MNVFTAYVLAHIQIITPEGESLKGYIHMITVVSLLYTWLSDIYSTNNIHGYNYQLLDATSSFL